MKYELDEEIYSYEAIRIAKEIIDEKGKIKIKKDNINIIIECDDENLIKKVVNEALNQQCRIDLLKENSKIANMILTKAIVSALGENKESKR